PAMKEDRLDILLHALFEESLGNAELDVLNALLSSSPDARARYRRAAAVHSALARKAAAPSYFETGGTARVTARRKPWLAVAAAITILAAGSTYLAMRPRGPSATVLETQGI